MKKSQKKAIQYNELILKTKAVLKEGPDNIYNSHPWIIYIIVILGLVIIWRREFV